VQRLGSARGTSLTGRVVGPTQRAEEVQKKKLILKRKRSCSLGLQGTADMHRRLPGGSQGGRRQVI
jgi:hypothetical protein